MKRPELSRRKEPDSTPPQIQIEDLWTAANPELLPFRIDAEKLSALAVRDLGFTPFNLNNTKLILSDRWGMEYGKRDLSVSISLGVHETYQLGIDSREGAKKAHQQLIVDPEELFEATENTEELFTQGFQKSMIAAVMLRQSLVSAKTTIDEALQEGTRRRNGLAIIASIGSGAAGAYLLSKGVNLLGVPGIGVSIGLSRVSGKLSERAKNVPTNDGTGGSYYKEEIPFDNPLGPAIDEWASIFNFDPQPPAST